MNTYSCAKSISLDDVEISDFQFSVNVSMSTDKWISSSRSHIIPQCAEGNASGPFREYECDISRNDKHTLEPDQTLLCL